MKKSKTAHTIKDYLMKIILTSAVKSLKLIILVPFVTSAGVAANGVVAGAVQ